MLGYIGESAVVIVLVENALAVRGYEEVRPAVTVIVRDSHAHSEISSADTSFLRYVSEGAVAIVVVERAAHGLRRFPKVAGAAIDKIDIHPAVIIVVKEGAARSECFGGPAR